MKNRLQIVLATVSLLAGMMIYLLFRSREYLGFVVLDALGLKSAVDVIRSWVEGVAVPDFVSYCLPDGLWTVSYILFSDYCNRNEPLRTRLIYASVIPLLGCVSELLQLATILPGVFDIRDLVCYILPLLTYIGILISKHNENISID